MVGFVAEFELAENVRNRLDPVREPFLKVPSAKHRSLPFGIGRRDPKVRSGPERRHRYASSPAEAVEDLGADRRELRVDDFAQQLASRCWR